MSLGNGNPQSGDQGSNFNYQMSVLQMLKQLQVAVTAMGGGTTVGTASPVGPLRVTGSGTVPANTFSVSVYNAGNANGTFNGGTVKPGEVLSWTAPSNTTFPNTISYNGSGTELVIAYVV